MTEPDVYSWEYKSRMLPWKVAAFNGSVAFGWRLESMSASAADGNGFYDVVLTWRRKSAWQEFDEMHSNRKLRFQIYRKATCRDLFHLGVAWFKSHQTDAALIGVTLLATAIFLCRIW